ncbi:hypothetical protein [Leucobacter ruminantium]|uniref:Uncharacterized protein n=1 Tax=Leucobacter ruminantium TaxID=1289170 RepID=A0A939LZP9_9MICO|nr:hypothetical protein [Leucobacter ruminantium]MBO1805888.1 hypothetical protein [Leucobacter ruminantium]
MSAAQNSDWQKLAASWKAEAEQVYTLNKDIVALLNEGRADLQALAQAMEQGALGNDPTVLAGVASMFSSLHGELDQVCSQYRNAVRHDWLEGQTLTPTQFGRWARAATCSAWLLDLINAIESRIPAHRAEPRPFPGKLDLR